jgi:hypothetical protein
MSNGRGALLVHINNLKPNKTDAQLNPFALRTFLGGAWWW